MHKHDPDDWLTLTAAARRAGRSYAWARDRAAYHGLERMEGTGRRILVSARSVDEAITKDRSNVRPRRPEARKGPVLRLVVDNTK